MIRRDIGPSRSVTVQTRPTCAGHVHERVGEDRPADVLLRTQRHGDEPFCHACAVAARMMRPAPVVLRIETVDRS